MVNLAPGRCHLYSYFLEFEFPLLSFHLSRLSAMTNPLILPKECFLLWIKEQSIIHPLSWSVNTVTSLLSLSFFFLLKVDPKNPFVIWSSGQTLYWQNLLNLCILLLYRHLPFSCKSDWPTLLRKKYQKPVLL